MNTVFVTQDLKRYHCPKCDSTYTERVKYPDTGYKCRQCEHIYKIGIAKPRDSLTEAAVYGDLEILFHGNDIGIALQPLVISMQHSLRNFSDDDFLLTVGSPVLIGLASIIAAKANQGRITFLSWDRRTRAYIKIKVKT